MAWVSKSGIGKAELLRMALLIGASQLAGNLDSISKIEVKIMDFKD